MGECVVCQQAFDEEDLLFGDRGLTCAVCVATGEEQAETQKGLWTLIIAPPLCSFSSMGALCIPLVGVGIALLMSCMALLGGLQAVQTGYRMSAQEEGVPEHMRTALLVSGAVTSVSAVGLTALYFLMVVAIVVALAS